MDDGRYRRERETYQNKAKNAVVVQCIAVSITGIVSRLQHLVCGSVLTLQSQANPEEGQQRTR